MPWDNNNDGPWSNKNNNPWGNGGNNNWKGKKSGDDLDKLFEKFKKKFSSYFSKGNYFCFRLISVFLEFYLKGPAEWYTYI